MKIHFTTSPCDQNSFKVHMKGSLSNLGDCHIIQKLRWWCYKYITVALFLSPGCRFVKSEGEKCISKENIWQQYNPFFKHCSTHLYMSVFRNLNCWDICRSDLSWERSKKHNLQSAALGIIITKTQHINKQEIWIQSKQNALQYFKVMLLLLLLLFFIKKKLTLKVGHKMCFTCTTRKHLH